MKLIFDRLSVPFAILTFVLSGTIGAFATRYMHRERGYNRFFMLYAIFMLGMIVASLAGTIETLFAGWELVGLSSALLVAFFQERAAPSRNGLWVWIVYRVSDAALLLAAVVLHHLSSEGDFDKLLGAGSWPGGHLEHPARVRGGPASLPYCRGHAACSHAMIFVLLVTLGRGNPDRDVHVPGTLDLDRSAHRRDRAAVC